MMLTAFAAVNADSVAERSIYCFVSTRPHGELVENSVTP